MLPRHSNSILQEIACNKNFVRLRTKIIKKLIFAEKIFDSRFSRTERSTRGIFSKRANRRLCLPSQNTFGTTQCNAQPMVFRNMDTCHWCYLSLVLPIIGVTCHWCYLSLVLPIIGVTYHWCYLSLVLPIIGVTYHWCYLSLVLPIISVTYHWCYLSLVLPIIGVTYHWCYLSLVLPIIGVTYHWCYLSLVLPIIGVTYHWCYIYVIGVTFMSLVLHLCYWYQIS